MAPALAQLVLQRGERIGVRERLLAMVDLGKVDEQRAGLLGLRARTSSTMVPMVLKRKCGSTCDCRARSSMRALTSCCRSSSKLASCVEMSSAKPVASAV